jgi:Cu2+-exporting ATPase
MVCRTKVEKTLNARRSGCRDFKSATISMGNPSKLCIFSIAAGNYSIKVFNPNDALLPTEEVTIALQRMLQENTTAPCFAKTIKYMMKRAIVLFVVWTWYKHQT